MRPEPGGSGKPSVVLEMNIKKEGFNEAGARRLRKTRIDLTIDRIGDRLQ